MTWCTSGYGYGLGCKSSSADLSRGTRLAVPVRRTLRRNNKNAIAMSAITIATAPIATPAIAPGDKLAEPWEEVSVLEGEEDGENIVDVPLILRVTEAGDCVLLVLL